MSSVARFSSCVQLARPRMYALAVLVLLVIMFGLLWAPSALAVGITVTGTVTDEVGVDVDAGIVATYGAAINPTTVTTQTFVAQGMMSGLVGLSSGKWDAHSFGS